MTNTTLTTQLRALGNDTRFSALQVLALGSLTVTQLAKFLRVRPSVLSEHLRVLRETGLVEFRELGNRRVYCLTSGVVVLGRTLMELFKGEGD